MKKNFNITDMVVNNMDRPIGTDQIPPVFGWKMEAEGNGRYQKAYRIEVKEAETGNILWDTGRVDKKVSTGINYQGGLLSPCTRYSWRVFVWNESDICVTKSSWFETGLLNSSREVWDGAKFISTPGQELCASEKGVFGIEAEIRIPKGSVRGGLVFGKNDRRLLDSTKNIYGIAAESYIAYWLDISALPATLHIYRVGYAKSDRVDVPLASVPVVDMQSKKAIITEENCNDYHKLVVEVYGNHAKTFIDDICIDAVTCKEKYPPAEGQMITRGRVLNPLGINDVTTFPRLNEVGFVVENGEIHIKKFVIRNIRAPRAKLLALPGNKEFDDMEQNFLEAGLVRGHDYYIAKSERIRQFTILPDHGSVPLLRRCFEVADKKLKKVRLYVTARGIYEGEVNGRRISDEFFCPGASQFDKHLYYQTYDLTDHVRQGKNAISFYVASGWWSDSQTFTLMNHNYYGDKPSLMAKLHIWYEDGQEEKIVTDSQYWKCTKKGSVTYAGFFNGEHYDATRKALFAKKSCSDFDDNDWLKAVEIPTARMGEAEKIWNWPRPDDTNLEFIGQPERGVRIAEILTAKEILNPREDVFVYDMGQNMAGVPKITFSEKRGQVITLRYGEILYPDLDEYHGLAGLILTENLRDADCTDIYICSGEEKETYMPAFTFHGYRYVEITGVSKPPEIEDVKGVVLSSIGNFDGNIETSSRDVNRLFANICWSQRANFISIPTDCPQRNERMGWLGDAQVFVRTAVYNADVQLFLRRFLQSVRDLQMDNGRYQDIAPIGGGFGGIAWGCAGIIIPWELYLQYGNMDVLEENCDAMLKYGEYLNDHRKNNLVDGVGFLGDWLAADETTDKNLLWDAIYAYVLKLLYKILCILKRNEAAKYNVLYEKTKKAWNEAYVDRNTGMTCTREGIINDTQCSYALPLAYEIFSDQHKKTAGTHLNRKTIELNYTLTTGFLGTGAISEALCNSGYIETAYKLLQQTKFPSWLYSVTQGATTIWERWNSFTLEHGFGGNNSMNSFNHYSLGAVGAWMYTHMLGIRRKEESPGFQEFVLQPEFGNLNYAEGFYKSSYGEIKSEWSRRGDKILYKATIPANTTAELILPGKSTQILSGGTYEFECENMV